MDIKGETIQNGEPSPEYPVEIENKTNILLAIEILKKLKTAKHHIQVDKPDGGEEIIRYGKPIYEELPDWDWLEEYKNIIDNAYKKLEYIIHCKKTETERSELIEKTEFGEKYFGRDWYPISNGNICNIINYIARQKIHYTEKNRLEKEFKGE